MGIIKKVVVLKRQSINNLKIVAMKNLKIYFLAIAFLLPLSVTYVSAQEEVEEEETSSPVSVGADFVSTYVWRGTAFSGPSLQPYVDLTVGGFSIGAWGSQGFDGFQEMDLYASYSFDFGLSLGITDYYYPGTEYFEYSDTAGAHAFEINGGFEAGNFSIAANFILNEAGGAGSAGSDMYFELGYSFGVADVFVGAGDGWHTSDNDFALCNVGVSASKEIQISDKFALPLFGSAILNPETEQFYIVAGISF